jgi:hypothetical protein
VLDVGTVLREYLAGLLVEAILDHEFLGDDAGDTSITWAFRRPSCGQL